MGVPAGFEPILLELAQRAMFSGSVCTLGVMDVPPGQNADEFFSKLGFSTVEALDVSDY